MADSANCTCETNEETISHYLLACPTYNEPRKKLKDKLVDIIPTIEPSLEILMNGTNEVDEEHNIKILEATMIFIEETKRFDSDT